jgi:hypothetical protein
LNLQAPSGFRGFGAWSLRFFIGDQSSLWAAIATAVA